jgi:RNA polymerase sigma factor (TIGR02999 family)
MSGVTQILAAIDRGEPQAAEQLLPLIYDELRKLAAAKLKHEKPGQTLQATALVHEAYLRLVGPAGTAPPIDAADARSEVGDQRSDEPIPTSDLRSPTSDRSRRAGGTYSSRGHFFAAAAEAMRRILIEQARRKNRVKHGGGQARVELADAHIASPMPADELLALDEALQRFATEEPLKARLVELRFFVGLTNEEAAEMLGISAVTAKRHWRYARAWLHQAVGEDGRPRVDSARILPPA